MVSLWISQSLFSMIWSIIVNFFKVVTINISLIFLMKEGRWFRLAPHPPTMIIFFSLVFCSLVSRFAVKVEYRPDYACELFQSWRWKNKRDIIKWKLAAFSSARYYATSDLSYRSNIDRYDYKFGYRHGWWPFTWQSISIYCEIVRKEAQFVAPERTNISARIFSYNFNVTANKKKYINMKSNQRISATIYATDSHRDTSDKRVEKRGATANRRPSTGVWPGDATGEPMESWRATDPQRPSNRGMRPGYATGGADGKLTAKGPSTAVNADWWPATTGQSDMFSFDLKKNKNVLWWTMTVETKEESDGKCGCDKRVKMWQRSNAGKCGHYISAHGIRRRGAGRARGGVYDVIKYENI